jgi:hypothetical protein
MIHARVDEARQVVSEQLRLAESTGDPILAAGLSFVMAAKFELFKDKSGDFRFHLKAANGQIIASGQGYKTKAAAEKGIESVKTNAPGAAVVDLTE